MKRFENAVVFVEGEGLKRRTVRFDDTIREIGENLPACVEDEVIALPQDAVVLPGFIDRHVHGAGGADAMDGTQEALSTIARTLAQEGTTGFLATTMTQSRENILTAMRAVKAYREAAHEYGAAVLGIHLEGPFIAQKFKGAQPAEYVAAPDIKQFEEYNEASGNAVRIVTLAPEVEGARELIAYLDEHGIRASIGHSAAGHEAVVAAMAAGATCVTHTFNAQSPVHHRDIGVAGSALLYDELDCELIADTIHVSVPAIRLLAKNKPAEKLSLITDAMRAKGMPDGESELGGQAVFVKNGEARLADGTLAGSVLRMNRALQNMVEKAGIPFARAVGYATENPARAIGAFGEVGSIRVGKRADFAVLNGGYDVLLTVRGGNTVHSVKKG